MLTSKTYRNPLTARSVRESGAGNMKSNFQLEAYFRLYFQVLETARSNRNTQNLSEFLRYSQCCQLKDFREFGSRCSREVPSRRRDLCFTTFRIFTVLMQSRRNLAYLIKTLGASFCTQINLHRRQRSAGLPLSPRAVVRCYSRSSIYQPHEHIKQ